MNKVVPFLTRQIVYSFLIGLLIGGFVIGVLDVYGRNPMMSKAFMSAEYGGLPVDCTSFYMDTATCWRSSFGNQNQWYYMGGGGGNYSPSYPTNTPTTGGNTFPGTPNTSTRKRIYVPPTPDPAPCATSPEGCGGEQ